MHLWSQAKLRLKGAEDPTQTSGSPAILTGWSKQVTHRQEKGNKRPCHQKGIPHFGSRLSVELRDQNRSKTRSEVVIKRRKEQEYTAVVQKASRSLKTQFSPAKHRQAVKLPGWITQK